MPQITVLYDNHQHPETAELIPAHGFSALIEFQGLKILFDTGWDGDILLNNARVLDVKLNKLDAVVISHLHWDHAGGIIKVLQEWQPEHIYLPSDYSSVQPQEFLRYAPEIQIHRQAEASRLQEVSPELISTGTLKSKIGIGEQSLLIPSERFGGYLVLVGCLHPGLAPIFNLARKKKWGKISAFMGGMHGFKDRKFLAATDINSVYAGHCTKFFDELSSIPKISFSKIHVGFQLDI